MSLFLIELKIKTALELVEMISHMNNNEAHEWRLPVHQNCERLRGVLREIINRPKEEEDRG